MVGEFESIISFNYPAANSETLDNVRNGYGDDIPRDLMLPKFSPDEAAEIRQIMEENPNAAKYILDILKVQK